MTSANPPCSNMEAVLGGREGEGGRGLMCLTSGCAVKCTRRISKVKM